MRKVGKHPDNIAIFNDSFYLTFIYDLNQESQCIQWTSPMVMTQRCCPYK